MFNHYATHEPLFLRERVSADLFTEKIGAALSRVPDDEKKWPAHVFSELCKEFPYLTQYDIEIVIDRMDPEAGAALGYAQVQNKTMSRPQEATQAAGNVIRVPIIIKDRRLQRFYIFEAGGQTYPMGESRIQQAMLNPLVFDTDSATMPKSPGLLDQIYPPGGQRTGFGRVSEPGAMGLTKLNSASLRAFFEKEALSPSELKARLAARAPAPAPAANPGRLAPAQLARAQAAEAAAASPRIQMPAAPLTGGPTHVAVPAASSAVGPHAAQVQAAPPTRGPAAAAPPLRGGPTHVAVPAASSAVGPHAAQVQAAPPTRGPAAAAPPLRGGPTHVAVPAASSAVGPHAAQVQAAPPTRGPAAAAPPLRGGPTHVAVPAASSAVGPHAAQVQAAPPTRGPAAAAPPLRGGPTHVAPAATTVLPAGERAVASAAHVAPAATTVLPAGERAVASAAHVAPAAEQAAAKATGGIARHLTGRNALIAAGATGVVAGGGLLAHHLLKRPAPVPVQKSAEHVPVPEPGVVAASLQPVLSILLALHQLYYFAHWTSQGEASYSDHQLFTRLYESTQEDFDNVAERIVGHGGNAAMDPAAIFAQASAQSAQWIGSGESIIAAALAGEQEVQATLMNAYGQMDQGGGLSLGIDDMLMAIASKHETNQYLLKQRDPNGGAVAAPMVEEAPVQEQAAPVQEAVPQEAQVAAPAPAQAAPPKTASLRSFFTRTSA
jgi:DNA-binding ferritin-like protein